MAVAVLSGRADTGLAIFAALKENLPFYGNYGQ